MKHLQIRSLFYNKLFIVYSFMLRIFHERGPMRTTANSLAKNIFFLLLCATITENTGIQMSKMFLNIPNNILHFWLDLADNKIVQPCSEKVKKEERPNSESTKNGAKTLKLPISTIRVIIKEFQSTVRDESTTKSLWLTFVQQTFLGGCFEWPTKLTAGKLQNCLSASQGQKSLQNYNMMSTTSPQIV